VRDGEQSVLEDRRNLTGLEVNCSRRRAPAAILRGERNLAPRTFPVQRSNLAAAAQSQPESAIPNGKHGCCVFSCCLSLGIVSKVSHANTD
jgi:hypothetical protein